MLRFFFASPPPPPPRFFSPPDEGLYIFFPLCVSGEGFLDSALGLDGAAAAPLFGIQAAVFNQSSGQLFVSGPNGTGDTVCGKCKYSEVMDVIKVTSAGVWKQLD